MLTRARELASRHPFPMHSLLLVVAVVGLYLQTAGHDFLLNWDDGDYITQNDDIMGFTIPNLWSVFTKMYVGNYAPVHLLSYMVDYSLWGMNPAAFKATNYLLHLGCTLLFYRLLGKLGLTPVQSLVAALIFAVHPVQVESVAWASQRKNPLSLFFFLASWHLWIRSREDGAPDRGKAHAFSLACFALALLAKSVAVILPLFLLAQDHLLNGRKISRRVLWDKWPYIVLAAGCFAMALISQSNGAGGSLPYYGGRFTVTMMNMLPVFSRYLTMLIAPFQLTNIYNATIRQEPDVTVWLGAGVLVLFLLGWVRLYRPHPRHFFFLTLFVVGLLPVSNIIPIPTIMNDRYLYYPMLGMAPFAVLSVGSGLQRLPSAVRGVLFALVAVYLSLLVTVSYSRISVWQSSLTLWPDTIAKSEAGAWYGNNANFLTEAYADALARYARSAYDRGDVKKAVYHYLLALNYDPTCYQALVEYSKVMMLEGKALLVRPHLLTLADRFPRSDEAHHTLGVNYLMTEEYRKAAECFRKALAINPQNGRARADLGESEQKLAGKGK